jgi:hypothetical protein
MDISLLVLSSIKQILSNKNTSTTAQVLEMQINCNHTPSINTKECNIQPLLRQLSYLDVSEVQSLGGDDLSSNTGDVERAVDKDSLTVNYINNSGELAGLGSVVN